MVSGGTDVLPWKPHHTWLDEKLWRRNEHLVIRLAGLTIPPVPLSRLLRGGRGVGHDNSFRADFLRGP